MNKKAVMERFRSIWLLLCLLLLTSCAESSGLTGTWEAEIPIAVLGPDKQEEVIGLIRFVFRSDGTGSWSTEISGDYPLAIREFRYTHAGDMLTLTDGEDTVDTEFTMILSGDSLKLESRRGSFDLMRIK